MIFECIIFQITTKLDCSNQLYENQQRVARTKPIWKRNDLGGAPPFNTDDVQEAGSVLLPRAETAAAEMQASRK